MVKIKNNPAIFTKGDVENIPIVFVHGFPFDHNMWTNQVEELGREFFCVSYDIRGSGESPSSDGQFTMEMFVDDLMEIIKELKLSMPVVCGLSMGGYIVLRALEKFENNFRAAILCNTKSAADNNVTKINRAEGIKKINELGVEKFINDFVPNCFADESLSQTFYEETLRRSLKSSATGLKGCLLAMAGRTDTTEHLSKINLPVLIISGEKDKLFQPQVMKEMADPIPDSEFRIIPEAGHVSPLENPEAVNNVIRNFLLNKTKKQT